jgi:hypothetical protein
MLKIQFTIHNPLSTRFENIWCKGRGLTKHKAVELQLTKTTDIVKGLINITHGRDHAGFMIELGLLGYTVCFNIYDTRHWDYTNNRWEEKYMFLLIDEIKGTYVWMGYNDNELVEISPNFDYEEDAVQWREQFQNELKE